MMSSTAAFPVCAVIHERVSSAFSLLRAMTMTRAPAAASCRAVTRPIPAVAPVMRTVFPVMPSNIRWTGSRRPTSHPGGQPGGSKRQDFQARVFVPGVDVEPERIDVAVGMTYRHTMRKAKVALSLDAEVVRRVDELVGKAAFASRSAAVELALREKLERMERRRLSEELQRLDPELEKRMAEEGTEGDLESWPAW